MHRAELSAPLHLDSPHQRTQKPQLTSTIFTPPHSSDTLVYTQQHWLFITIITKTNISTHTLNSCSPESFYFKAVISSSMAVNITAALKVMNDVSEALHNNQHCLSLFIDLPLTPLDIMLYGTSYRYWLFD